MTSDKNRQWAICRLQKSASELERLPKKEDFDAADLSRIKAFLGPWPRALEAAGLKEKRHSAPTSKKRIKAAKSNNGNIAGGDK